MANKTTRELRKLIRAAGKAGKDSVEHLTPVHNYHSAGCGDDFRSKPTSFLRTQTFPTARVNGDGINSHNKRRNSCQRVYLNKGENGKTASVTAHEPWVKGEYMIFPNHKQYANFEYRRKAAGQVSA